MGRIGDLNLSRRVDLLQGFPDGYQLIRSASGGLSYRYLCGDWGFRFSLLCEVGEPYRQPFVDRIRELVSLGMVFETYEVPRRPWLVDGLLPMDSKLPGGRPAYWQLR